MGWSEGVVVGEEEGFLMEVEEVGFAGGAAGVEGWGDEPVAFGTGGDEKAVHGPVVVFAEGEAVGGDGEGGTLRRCGWSPDVALYGRGWVLSWVADLVGAG